MLILVALISILIIGTLGWSWARSELKRNIFDHLTSVRTSKAYQVESYFKILKNHVETLCEDQMVVAAMKDFRNAYEQLYDIKTLTTQEHEALQTYYEQEFFPRLTERILGSPNYTTYRPDSKPSEYLQYQYITANPHPVGQKDALENAQDGSVYTALHDRYHKLFKHLVKKFGYYDLFLIDPETAQIIYSVYKETDFGTSLENGPYSRSNFARLVSDVRDNPDPGAIQVVDFAMYKPSYFAPAAFMGGPIYDGTNFVGILAVQMPVDEINRVLTGNQRWKQDGLGESGETYLVGTDYLMRSVSRFLIEKPEQYKETLRSIGFPRSTVQLIDQLDTSILLQRVKTEAAKASLSGQEGTQITDDYRGVPVLSSYAPLHIEGLEWAILSEMDLAESYAPVYSLTTYLFLSTVILILVLTLIAGITATRFVKPIDALIAASHKAQVEDGEIEMLLESDDEFGELAGIFNDLVYRMREHIEQAEQRYRKSQTLLLNFLPFEVLRRIDQDEKNIFEQIHPVTVLSAKVIGLGQLVHQYPPERVSQLLNELLNSFDGIAQKSDIDRFKFASDRYLAVCGLSKPRLDHERRILDFALKILDQIQTYNNLHQTSLSLCIGIDTGTVITGLLDTQPISYDLWGEPVAFASLLMDHAEINTIVTTNVIHERLQDFYNFHKGNILAFEGQEQMTWILKTEPQNVTKDWIKSSDIVL
ncbi:adenylate/guanylate cyclase domain-containing protein [Spirulina sp. CS-785/01]|uniref:adenylate/guanylate cyclase domain-containing protein n=1 Tax=Spirulina sp. CS-785/01 TaxID=3021716 RepID=UPI0023300F9A|nr:adenylate/guanylate cyclase domain-containing protein [Spirulina sp. CS-785/01]MDB9312239.1 adenylate/guanylate cyclase domain-containing protein [Spirulina sp. CS-785/01]